MCSKRKTISYLQCSDDVVERYQQLNKIKALSATPPVAYVTV